MVCPAGTSTTRCARSARFELTRSKGGGRSAEGADAWRSASRPSAAGVTQDSPIPILDGRDLPRPPHGIRMSNFSTDRSALAARHESNPTEFWRPPGLEQTPECTRNCTHPLFGVVSSSAKTRSPQSRFGADICEANSLCTTPSTISSPQLLTGGLLVRVQPEEPSPNGQEINTLWNRAIALSNFHRRPVAPCRWWNAR